MGQPWQMGTENEELIAYESPTLLALGLDIQYYQLEYMTLYYQLNLGVCKFSRSYRIIL